MEQHKPVLTSDLRRAPTGPGSSDAAVAPSSSRLCACLTRRDSEQHQRCRALRAWVACWVADDVNYARMVEYDARHGLGRLEGYVCASSRQLLVASVAGSLGE